MKRFIEGPSSGHYDVIVIGGGITGAAVAYEAASLGLSVALVDKGDFGAATSSATSKMIHGGLRYLANLEFGLIRESLRERRTLANIAPNLVYPAPFLLPLYNSLARSRWLVQPGMIVYDILSYDKAFTWDKSKKIPLHRFVSREETLRLEPIINPAGLTGAILYYDSVNIAPERLTLSFIKSAVNRGADVANYAKVEGFLREAGRIAGVVVRDLLTDQTLELHGKLTINCGGPWADLVLDIAAGKRGTGQIKRSEGIHLITKSLTRHYSVGAATPSGRHCAVRPWRGHSLIGTTEKEYVGDPDKYQVTRDSIEEYIREVNAAFGKDVLLYGDVLYAYGGLRPLVDDKSRDVNSTSRKYEIYDNQRDGLDGLLSVEGGKYTTSRNLAESVLKLALKKLGMKPTKSITAQTYLAGSDIPDLDAFVASAKSENRDFPECMIDYLARHYGTELPQVLQIARSAPRYAMPLNADGEILAQVVYAIRFEMARSLPDILLRRTGLGTLGHPGEGTLKLILETAAEELNWSKSRAEKEIALANKLINLPSD
jgi:glycerol-3-phosphate dehydrogenase